MHAPPPPHALRLEELGDRMLICVRPRRAWGAIAGRTLALTLWTVFGLLAFSQPSIDLHSPEPLLIACVWFLAGCSQAFGVAWRVLGRELLIVTLEHLEVRRQLGRLARTKSYAFVLVRNVHARRVPANEDELERRDFCLEFTYDGEPVRVGEQMTEPEAEYVAWIVSSWSQQDVRELEERHAWDGAETLGQRTSWPLLARLLFPAFVVAALVLIWVNTLRLGA